MFLLRLYQLKTMQHQQLRSGFKRTINWNKYEPKFSTERYNQYLDFLIDPSFQAVNRLFVLPFENEDDRKVHTEYYFSEVEIKDYNVMTDGKNIFDQTIRSNMKTYDNIKKLEQVKMMITQLVVCWIIRKQQTLDAELKAMQ